MSQIMDRQLWKDGQVLFREGQPASKLYLIAQGEVELYKQTDKGSMMLCCCCVSGEFIGINALLSGETYSATAKVKGGATIIPVEQTKILEQVGKLDKLTSNVVFSIVKRFNRLMKERCAAGVAEQACG